MCMPSVCTTNSVPSIEWKKNETRIIMLVERSKRVPG